MDEQSATKLLAEVRSCEKQAVLNEGVGLASQSLFGPGRPDIDYTAIRKRRAGDRAYNRTSTILQGLLLAGAGGAALRGALGLGRLTNEVKPQPRQTVDMPVPFPADKEEEEEKTAKEEMSFLDRAADAVGLYNSDATSNAGQAWMYPAALLGVPAAGYLSWKGMDAIMDKQRRRRSERKLDKAKEDYEEALLGSYKQSSDVGDQVSCSAQLDKVFDNFEKAAAETEKTAVLGNVPGAVKGLLATYALLSGPTAYMYVNDRMKKNSRRAVLEKAVKERARRAAKQQPFELYASPKPVDIDPEEEDN